MSAVMGTNEFWSGTFGDDYTARNRVDWRARIPFWREILDATGARSVYEVGANAGWNLSAIKRACPDVAAHGHDVNERAVIQAEAAGLNVVLDNSIADGSYDLVFTAGVLIHIAPKDLHKQMRAIVKASSDYVLAVEYAADTEEEVEYRGHAGKLWKRPYGQLYADMGLTLVTHKHAPAGFDRCEAWLLRR